MGYRGRGYLRNTDMEVDASDASRGQFIWTRRGNDEVTGSEYRDRIYTGRGDDTVEGGGGNDVMFGGKGRDTAVFSGSVLDYQVSGFGRGPWTYVQGEDGCDFLHSFEVLQFDDFTFDLAGDNAPLVILRDEGSSTSEGDALQFQVDYYDLDGTSVELVSASVTGGGTLTAQDSGASQTSQIGVGGGASLSFDPGTAYDSLGAGESTTETVTLVISDDEGNITTVTYDIVIEGQNDAPVAMAVSATVDEDGPAVTVSADYSDVDATDTHTFSIDTSATLGAVTDNGDGTFGYDPSGAFDSLSVGETATDSFTYTVDDGNGGTATETVTITVTGQNDAPVAMAVTDTADEDGPAITIAADFTDVDAADSHTFSVDTTGTLGAVTDNGDGTFGYDPSGAFDSLAVGETATDSFTYTVDDGNGGTSTETVTVAITGQNDAPIINVANSDLVEEIGAGFTTSGSFDAQDFIEAFDPTSGTASIQTVGGQDAMRVNINTEDRRAPHTVFDIVEQGALEANDKVVVTVQGEVARTGGDQDVFFGLTDGVGQVSYFSVNSRAGRLYNGELKTDSQPGDSLQDGAIELNLLNLSGGQQNTFSLEIVLDGLSDVISVFSSSGALIGTFDGFDPASSTPDQTNAIDPSLGLKLFLASDGDNETNYFVGLDYDMEITRQGTIEFNDVDVTDEHTAEIDAVRFVGDAGGLTSAQALALIELSVNSTAAQASGSVDWAFDIGAVDAAYLAAGEMLMIEYDVTVQDGNGGFDTQTLSFTVNGTNDAPVAQAVTGTVDEDPQVASSDGIGAYTIPNAGHFYVYDFDTGTAASIQRDGGANFTFDQIAAQYLSEGNGVIVQPNPNSTGWAFAGEVFVDGTGQTIASTDWVINGGNGDVDLSNPQWILFADTNQNIDSIELDISGLDLGGGVTVDAQISVGPLNYEFLRTDDLRVDGASFSSTLNGPSPSVTVAAHVTDPDSDTFVFTIDDSGTLGNVINNGDGTFTYSADGTFEHLNSGETATDSFAYTVDDGDGGLDTETVTITILGSDDILFA
ncbi:VCBS domain-containing protein [Phaeobacter sp. A90-2a-3-a]|uniref:VCBS domain-containing protein n=2 Tax=Phaeobacter TaxID=302485 RepID=UPI003A847E3A